MGFSKNIHLLSLPRLQYFSLLCGTAYRALFNEEQDCPGGPHVSNRVRGERPALDRGTIQGGKPADNVPRFVAEAS
jgi:hypothetical protein